MTIKTVDNLDDASYKLEGVAALLEHMAYSVKHNGTDVPKTSNALNMLASTVRECNDILRDVSSKIEKEVHI